MDRAAEMTAFIRAVDNGGFTAAARQMGLTPSALSRLVGRLEDRLGVRLLHRTTRRVQITPDGETFYLRARAILQAMDEAEAEIAHSVGTRPRGLLRVYCGSAFGMHQLTPALPRFQARYPEIEIDLTISDQMAPRPEDNFDLEIRIGPLDESSLVARRICNLERMICASPQYLSDHGVPTTPDDLLKHNCLWLSSLPALRRWPFDTDEGIRVVPVSGNLIANNAETMLQLAIVGCGITRLPDVMIGDALRTGQLVPVLMAWHHVEPIPLYATYPSGRNLSPKTRAMVDFLVETFSHAPWRKSATTKPA